MIWIDGYPIDIAVSETYTFDAQVTSLPVELGADITDHVRTGPVRIELECVVSDTPIGAIASDPTRSIEGLEDVPGARRFPATDTFDRLVMIRNARRPIIVETSRGRWENMILSFTVPDDLTTSGGLRFVATLQQIVIVENQRLTVVVRTAEPRGRGKNRRGTVAATARDLGFTTWRRGSPPGSNNITRTDLVRTDEAGKFAFVIGGRRLNTEELRAFAADMDRERRATIPKFDELEKKNQAIGDRIERLQALLDAKERHPNMYIDPKIFGL